MRRQIHTSLVRSARSSWGATHPPKCGQNTTISIASRRRLRQQQHKLRRAECLLIPTTICNERRAHTVRRCYFHLDRIIGLLRCVGVFRDPLLSYVRIGFLFSSLTFYMYVYGSTACSYAPLKKFTHPFFQQRKRKKKKKHFSSLYYCTYLKVLSISKGIWNNKNTPCICSIQCITVVVVFRPLYYTDPSISAFQRELQLCRRLEQPSRKLI